MLTSSSQPLVLFDGVCNLCNSAVTFIIERDPKAHFQFASLQSSVGQDILQRLGRSSDQFDSFILLENGHVYERSTAALRIARQLSGGWPLLYGFVIVPPALRNAVYRFVAKNRYRWFGKSDACMMPTPALKARFVS